MFYICKDNKRYLSISVAYRWKKTPLKIGEKCSLFFFKLESVESKVKPFSVVHTGILGCSFDSKS